METGYFVRRGTRAGASTSDTPENGNDSQVGAPPRSRRRRRPHLGLRHVLLVAAAALLAWASTTEGGLGARIGSLVDRGRVAVEGATEDPVLREAAATLNARFEREGSYPVLTEARLREDPELSWGVGVEVARCSPRSVVLMGLTGHGTITRLLVDGTVVGDVRGIQACPQDLANPAPWKR